MNENMPGCRFWVHLEGLEAWNGQGTDAFG